MIPVIFAWVAVLVGAVSLFARAAWLQAAAYWAMIVALIVIWFGSLGHARPAFPLITPRSGTVISFRLDEPHAIYVWLGAQGREEPLSLVLPWNVHQAQQLEQAARQAAAGHGSVQMRGRSDRGGAGSGQEKPMFYPAPPAPLPSKVSP